MGHESPDTSCHPGRLIQRSRSFVRADGHHSPSIHAGPRRLGYFDEDETHIGMERLVPGHVVDPAENSRTGAPS